MHYRFAPTLVAASMSVAAQAGPAPIAPGPTAPVGEIAQTLRLPASGLQMIQTTDGRTFYVSDNGRYLLNGPVKDLWHGGEELTSVSQARDLADRIDLARLKLDPHDLGALDYGEGKRDVVVFIDPYCPHCAQLLQDLPALRTQYRFRLVPLPVLGEPSQRAVVALACRAETDAKAALALLMQAKANTLPAPKGESTCGVLPVQQALVAARLFGLSGTPFLIAPDGRMRNGAPKDLAAWLNNAEDPNT